MKTGRLGRIVICILCVGLAPGLGACSDDDGASGDAGVDSGPDGWVGGELTVRVLDVTEDDVSGVPLAGVTVALDPPFDDRIEQLTDAAGETRFDAARIDWSVGTASITAHKGGYVIQSYVNLTEDDLTEAGGILELELFERFGQTPDATALLTGEATGMTDETNRLLVYPLAGWAETWQQSGPGFELTVARDQPFSLFVMEYDSEVWPGLSDRGVGQPIHHMDICEVSAIGDATEHLQVDLAAAPDGVSETHLSWTFPTGAGLEWMEGTKLIGWVFDMSSGRSIGFTERSDVNAAGTAFEMDLRWIERPSFEPRMQLSLGFANTGTSIVLSDGYPTAGPVALEFFAFPEWVEPANPRDYHSLYSPFEWRNNNPEVDVTLAVFRGDELLWLVWPGADATTATVPPAPSSFDYEQELAGYVLQTEVRVGHLVEGSILFERLAMSARLTKIAP